MGLVCAGVLGAFAARIGTDVVLSAYCVFGIALVVLSFVDLERQLIPSRVVYPAAAIIVPLLVVSSAVDDRWVSLGRAALGGAIAFVGFFLVHAVVPRGLGFGDVRLAGLIGVSTGWLGLGHAFVAFFSGFVLGAVVGVAVAALTGGGRKTRIPFGPFLAAGAFVAVVAGSPIANALFHRAS
jgi:leader peptidase (prepilin peptidase)/N-methyltransferase